MSDPEKIKEFIDKNDFGFTKIKTFEQLKIKVFWKLTERMKKQN